MAKLWLLIEESLFQKTVIDLLIKFYNSEPSTFANAVSNSFSNNDLEQCSLAIRRFSTFWKLTSEFYPDFIFFENGECIFKMLDFLDNDHPMLRHLSKSWLSQSIGQFSKILDPLLIVLLDKETSWYISPTHKLYYTREYDNRRIVDAFRKLKNIIINMTDKAIDFFIESDLTDKVKEADVLGDKLAIIDKNYKSNKYIDLLVNLSLRFIQGKVVH